MFLHTSGFRKIISLPSYILDDERLSIGAKGLFVQLFYSNDNICALNDLKSEEKWSAARSLADSFPYDIDATDENGLTDPSLYLTMLQDLYFRKKSELEALTIAF